jgi:hypothetical protein
MIAKLGLFVLGVSGPVAIGGQTRGPPIVGFIANCKIVIANYKLTSIITVVFCPFVGSI